MKKQYNKTIAACFTAYIVQAIINNFVPLLFLTFQRSYGISLSRITLLVTFNFGIQLLVDLLAIGFVDRIGYRRSMVLAHLLAAAGLVSLTILPEVLADPFVGILTAVMIYAVGGGLLEVLVSPVVEACPSENKEAAMSMLHSFYCWGHVGVILVSTLFFQLAGTEAWKLLALFWALIPLGKEVLVSPVVEACPSENKEAAMSMLHSFYCWGHVGVILVSTLFFQLAGTEAWKLLALFWALIPLGNMFAFLKVPLAPLAPEGESGMTIRQLLSDRLFWVLLLMMVCAGASEQAVSQVSQWASMFAEQGLGISKTLGDLAGPMAFALLMGISRAFYGKFGDRIALDSFMAGSSLLCIVSYLCIVFVPVPAVNLAACAFCGLSVGIMWPGTFSKAAAALPSGGTALFALLALGGDLGCSGGPTLAGIVSGVRNDNLKTFSKAAAALPSGGTALFALLALGGDLGCSGGPTLAGIVSGVRNDNLKAGILAAVIFPILLLAGIALCNRLRNEVRG